MRVFKIGLFLFSTRVLTGNLRHHGGSRFDFSSKKGQYSLELCNVVQTPSSEVLQEL